MNMWNRAELKSRAKTVLYKNYWSCVLVNLVMMLLINGLNVKSRIEVRNENHHNVFNIDVEDMTSDPVKFLYIFVIIAFGMLFVSGIVSLILRIFVWNIFEVGGKGFFVTNQISQPRAGELLSGFRSGNYGRVVGTLLLRDLYIVLWSFLFMIPGIIKSYQYRMVPYLLALHPEMSRQEVFAASRDMMYGNKWDVFVLDLSFFGWLVLNTFTLGILNIFFLGPYREATDAELYTRLWNGNREGGYQS